MNLQELKKIISRGEDSYNQFKEDVRNSDSLAAEIVAFSNSEGGRIFIGISNEGNLTGLSLADVGRINQLISNASNQHVRGPVTVQTENIPITSKRLVIALIIPEGIDKPYFDHQGVIWLKNGADKIRVKSKEELRRLFLSCNRGERRSYQRQRNSLRSFMTQRNTHRQVDVYDESPHKKNLASNTTRA